MIFGLLILAVGIFGTIIFQLHRTHSLTALIPGGQKESAAEAPITPAPVSLDHGPLNYLDWQPYFFHGKLIYCDANYKCKVKTDIDATAISFADQFSDGLARVALKANGKEDTIVYLGTSGKIELPADPDRVLSGPFSEGLAFSIDKISNKLGFIDKQGKYAITPRFYLAGSESRIISKENQLKNCFFSSGLAPVYTEGVTSRIPVTTSCGYVDHKGKFVVKPQFIQGCAFSDGRARVSVRDKSKWMKRWGYIDARGSMAIKPEYIQALDFTDSRAGVLNYLGRWGFVDPQGKFAVPASYSEVEPFSEGFAAVASAVNDKKRWGYIRKNGQWLVEPRFDSASPFKHGEAYACCGDPASKAKEEYWITANGKVERQSHQIKFDLEELTRSIDAPR